MEMDRKHLKSTAREAMRQARPNPFWVALLLGLVTLGISVLSLSISGALSAYRTMLMSAAEGTVTYVEPRPMGGIAGRVLEVALEVMTLELTVGFVIYALRVWRREKAGCGDIFDAFGVFFRAIWIRLLPSLFVSLWSLLYVVPVSALIVLTGHLWWLAAGLPLLIPAIMADYSYRLAVYIMLDNPGAGCFQCVALSREVMRGHRWQLFVLDMSFLGWALLSALLPLVGLILAVWVSVYVQVTGAGFYDTLMTDFMAHNAPPVEPGV